MKTAVLCLALLLSPLAIAADPGDDILSQSSAMVLTRGDYEAELARLPPEQRDAFATSSQRIEQLLVNLQMLKTLAAEARTAGVDREPLVARRMSIEADRALGQIYLQRLDEAAGAEFDRRSAELLPRVREIYVVDQAKYRTSEQVSASHILISTKTRSPAEALVLAQQARAKLAAGGDFKVLARELSEDPSAARNGGFLDWFTAETMDPAFSKAAFGLPAVGAISEPVLSSFGYHVIRLDGRRPAGVRSFDEVKGEILAEMRTTHVNKQREQRLAAIRSDPTTKVNEAAVQSLLKKFDPAAFRSGAPARPPR